MGKHALLSASSSKRWLSCTPSARLEEQFRDEAGGSVYAEEGTAAHALAEHKLKKALKRRSKRPVSDYHCDEMEECTDGYVAYAMEQVELARQECADPVVLIEQRLDYSAYVPEGFGTGDLLIVADKVLTVIDLKYGKGVAVEAEWNPQMMLYGLGALELFDALYDIEIIRMTIYQPRLESVSTWEISVKDLMEWVEMELKPKAVLAIKGEGEFHSGDWCRFCKAKNTCRARAEEYLRLAQMEFRQPPLLTDEEIAEVLKVADELAKWSADVYAYAMWVTTEYDFPYTGSYVQFVIPQDGIYEFEVWGAAGGTAKADSLVAEGGKGGHSKGCKKMKKDDVIYIYNGGSPKGTSSGSNGGGSGNSYTSSKQYGAGGGGSTHVATKSGALGSNNTSSPSYANRSCVLIVAGGGGGGGIENGTAHKGGDGGGERGGNGSGGALGGRQISTSSYPSDNFGMGDYYSSSSTCSSGGGGGWFGGNYGMYGESGAGGSGYVDGVAPFTHNGKYYPAETEAGVNDGNGKAFSLNRRKSCFSLQNAFKYHSFDL